MAVPGQPYDPRSEGPASYGPIGGGMMVTGGLATPPRNGKASEVSARLRGTADTLMNAITNIDEIGSTLFGQPPPVSPVPADMASDGIKGQVDSVAQLATIVLDKLAQLRGAL